MQPRTPPPDETTPTPADEDGDRQSLAQLPVDNPNPVLQLTAAGVVRYANQAAAPLLSQWQCAAGQPLPAPWAALVWEAHASGESREVEVACGTRVFALTFTPSRAGPEVQFYGYDVTRRVQAEQALRESERKLTTLVDLLPVGVSILDAERRVVYANPALARILALSPTGLTAGEYRARTYIRPDGRPMPSEAFASVRALQEQRAVTDVETGVVAEAGATIWTSVSAVPVDFPDWRVIIVTADITARHEAVAAQEALLVREQVALTAVEQALDRLHRLQQVTAALVEALTPEQVGQVLVQHSVDALEAQTAALALRSADGAGLTLVHAAGYPADVRDAWQHVALDAGTPLADCIQAGEAIYLESPDALHARYPGLGGVGASLGDGAWVMVPLCSAGQALGGLRITFPTARTFSEEERAFLLTLAQQGAAALERARLYAVERQARIAAEAATRQREEFLSIAAHELKTPLTSLLGSAQLLLMRAPQHEGLSARQQAGLERVHAQGQRLERMITRLLDFSRITQGRLQLERGAVNLSALVQGTVAELQVGNGRHQIVITGGEAPLWLHGDELRLTQVLYNLLENAVKYSPHGGTITVALTAAAQSVQVAVTDEGIGIPAADRSHLWERFYRAGNVDANHISGVGIGLYLVHEIVTLHGGQVAVASAEGQGSTFTITLPS